MTPFQHGTINPSLAVYDAMSDEAAPHRNKEDGDADHVEQLVAAQAGGLGCRRCFCYCPCIRLAGGGASAVHAGRRPIAKHTPCPHCWQSEGAGCDGSIRCLQLSESRHEERRNAFASLAQTGSCPTEARLEVCADLNWRSVTTWEGKQVGKGGFDQLTAEAQREAQELELKEQAFETERCRNLQGRRRLLFLLRQLCRPPAAAGGGRRQAAEVAHHRAAGAAGGCKEGRGKAQRRGREHRL